ncbi:hypothetical protein ABMA28_013219 [Loxostege sticticalis]|uniref:Laminin EGF-like domain-containing protein n=1 Tax=Loxostege sticticalis TaxID=481309 RepID=A0ABD0THI3_LOXSC
MRYSLVTDGRTDRRTDSDSQYNSFYPTAKEGLCFSRISLMFVCKFLYDLKMELLHVIIKAGPSPRPLAWSLEVSPSESNDDWRLVRAFGDRDHCRKLWDLRPERRRRKARDVRSKKGAKRSNRADKPACSTQFVSQKPLESGEMHVGLGEGVTARRVRVSFRAAHPAPARQQYYTVRALTLAARCLCHGHAAHCNVNYEGAKCDCVHGTCGAHCQRCCSGAAWAPHAACEERGCVCGDRGACTYDDSGAILCVNCTENRAGPLCDRCLTGFYNAVPDGPCLPCDCDPEGSDGSCKWDRRQHRITCSCYPGFAGHLCDTCEDPAAVFPSCQAPTTPACKCDPRGVVDPSRVCEDVCECKANVVGERCDACAPGHFGLSEELPTGCAPCYCTHITDSCAAAPEGHPPRDTILPMGEAWLVSDILGNETVEPSIDDRGKPFLISYEVRTHYNIRVDMQIKVRCWEWKVGRYSSESRRRGPGSSWRRTAGRCARACSGGSCARARPATAARGARTARGTTCACCTRRARSHGSSACRARAMDTLLALLGTLSRRSRLLSMTAAFNEPQTCLKYLTITVTTTLKIIHNKRVLRNPKCASPTRTWPVLLLNGTRCCISSFFFYTVVTSATGAPPLLPAAAVSHVRAVGLRVIQTQGFVSLVRHIRRERAAISAR